MNRSTVPAALPDAIRATFKRQHSRKELDSESNWCGQQWSTLTGWPGCR